MPSANHDKQSQISITDTSIGNRFPLHFVEDSDCFMNILITPWQTAPSLDWWSKIWLPIRSARSPSTLLARIDSYACQTSFSYKLNASTRTRSGYLDGFLHKCVAFFCVSNYTFENAALTPHLFGHRTSLMCSNLHHPTCRRLTDRHGQTAHTKLFLG